jgi:next-to-BRCA1 protein 1
MEKIAIRDLLVESVEPVHEKVVAEDNSSVTVEPSIGDSLNEGFDAHFVRDTILDGSKINAGYQFVQVWTLRNPGPNAWPAGCSVRHVGGDNMLNIDNTRPLSHAELADASESNVVGRSVEAGEELSFRVILKAPQREGTAISYWRLKTADGIPFGHRLWCDINVVAPPAFPTSQMIPSGPIPPPPRDPMYERLVQKNVHMMNAVQQAHAQHAQKVESLSMATVQRARQAAIERLLESRRRENEAALATINHEEPEAIQQSTAELPVEEKPAERAPELESSRMIFPQLDKESPESSTYESTTTVQPDSPRSEKSTVARTVTVTSDDEFFEDAESVALHSDDEGFETDEEYDILDASDEDLA